MNPVDASRRLPDVIVIEHPSGHLGAPNPAELDNTRFDFAGVLPAIFKVLDELGVARGPSLMATA